MNIDECVNLNGKDIRKVQNISKYKINFPYVVDEFHTMFCMFNKIKHYVSDAAGWKYCMNLIGRQNNIVFIC